jgi:hypothetical protein
MVTFHIEKMKNYSLKKKNWKLKIIIFSQSVLIVSYEEWIIQILACDNYDHFQHLNFIFSKKKSFTILRIV